MHRAQPKLDFIAPTFNPFILQLVHWSLPILQRFRLLYWLPAGISPIETINGERLVKLYNQFQSGEIRLLLAFRHCEVDDPLTGLYLFSRAMPQIARQQGINLQSPIHSHFMYDRGMTIWVGDWLGWLFAQMGGIPVHRGKTLDWQAMKKARELLINGQFPLAVAPEGATNGHSEIVSLLEPGVAQLAFWGVEDLAKANRREKVIVVPINIQYHYINPQWSKLDWLLSNLETDCGLSGQAIANSKEPEELYYQRILRLGQHFLSEMEQFYHRFYHYHLSDLSSDALCPEADLTLRLQKLLDISLAVGESYFGLKKKGNIIQRCRRLEEAGWNYIYQQDLTKLKNLSPLKRGLADWIATEADLKMLHMRLVESFVAVTGSYIPEKPCFERFAETSLLLFDAIARIKGRKNPRRPHLGWRKSTVTIGEPMAVSDRAIAYRQHRKGAKQAVTQLTQDLQTALQAMIV